MLLIHFLICLISGIGLAILLTEKGHEYPVKYFTVWFRRYFLRKLSKKRGRDYHERPEGVVFCPICMSFWASLICDLILFFFFTGIFLWPLTGFACLGIMYLIFKMFEKD
jgi:hypothetical protein